MRIVGTSAGCALYDEFSADTPSTGDGWRIGGGDGRIGGGRSDGESSGADDDAKDPRALAIMTSRPLMLLSAHHIVPKLAAASPKPRRMQLVLAPLLDDARPILGFEASVAAHGISARAL